MMEFNEACKNSMMFPQLYLAGFRVFVSDSGEQLIVFSRTMDFYLWETGSQGPQWWKIFPPKTVLLPEASYKEICVDAGFFVHQVYRGKPST